MGNAERMPVGVDLSRPTPARLYDYYLGGTNNFAVDRAAAEKIRARMPELKDAAWANRRFHQRAARWMAAERGVRQFIDIGSGLPTSDNTHHAVQRVYPAARVVYVDHDPMVLVHADQLLAGARNTKVITADLRDPAGTLDHPGLRALIDFTEPVGLLVTAVLHFVSDETDPWGIMARYLSVFAAGSHLALSHATADGKSPAVVAAVREVYAGTTEDVHLRPKADVERFFDGLEMAPPGEGGKPAVCFAGEWRPEDPAVARSVGSAWLYCGVARIPEGDFPA